MDIELARESGVVVLKPVGRLDANNGPTLEQAVTGVIDGGDSRFVIDMTGVPYISSAGLGTLLKTAKQARSEGGRVALSALQETVTKVFEVSGFLQLFVVHESWNEAVAELAGESGS